MKFNKTVANEVETVLETDVSYPEEIINICVRLKVYADELKMMECWSLSETVLEEIEALKKKYAIQGRIVIKAEPFNPDL